MATQGVAAASVAIAVALPCQYDESTVPDDQNEQLTELEQADGMEEEDGMVEVDGMEEDEFDVVVIKQKDNASVNSRRCISVVGWGWVEVRNLRMRTFPADRRREPCLTKKGDYQ